MLILLARAGGKSFSIQFNFICRTQKAQGKNTTLISLSEMYSIGYLGRSLLICDPREYIDCSVTRSTRNADKSRITQQRHKNEYNRDTTVEYNRETTTSKHELRNLLSKDEKPKLKKKKVECKGSGWIIHATKKQKKI